MTVATCQHPAGFRCAACHPENFALPAARLLPWTYDDGGRAAAGYTNQHDAGDCVVRALAIATGEPYRQVYDSLAAASAARGGRRSARDGVAPKVYQQWLAERRWLWTPRMAVGSTERTHLVADELPTRGRLICRLSRHLVAVVDGVVRDNHDPRRDGSRLVYGYWSEPHPRDCYPCKGTGRVVGFGAAHGGPCPADHQTEG